MAPRKEWPALRSWLRKVYNKKVDKYFNDEDNDSNINAGRKATKDACLIGADDSQNIALIKMNNFNFIVREIDKQPIYGIPCTSFHESLTFYPQVILYFKETLEDAQSKNRKPITAEHGYRLKNDNITDADIRELARKIRQEFATPPTRFKKGEIKISYKDKRKGYEFILAVDAESEARTIISKILDIQGDTPDWELLTNSESGKNFKVRRTMRLLGETVELQRQRPIGYVQFTHAELKLHGVVPDVVLVDVTGRYSGALIYA